MIQQKIIFRVPTQHTIRYVSEPRIDYSLKFFLNGPFQASFCLFSSFQLSPSKQLILNKVADDQIRPADLWCEKRPLYQLRHNQCPQIGNVYFISERRDDDENRWQTTEQKIVHVAGWPSKDFCIWKLIVALRNVPSWIPECSLNSSHNCSYTILRATNTTSHSKIILANDLAEYIF